MEDKIFNTPEFKRFFQAIVSGSISTGDKMTADRIKAIYHLVHEFPIEKLIEAIKNHYLTSEFPIKPANIVNYIRGSQPVANPALKAEEEFNKVYRLCQKHGRYSAIEFEDKKISYAINVIGGWIALCESTEYTLPGLKRGFIAAYQEAEKMKFISAPLQLPGRCGSQHIVRINMAGETEDRKALPLFRKEPEPENPEEFHHENIKKLKNLISSGIKTDEDNFSRIMNNGYGASKFKKPEPKKEYNPSPEVIKLQEELLRKRKESKKG